MSILNFLAWLTLKSMEEEEGGGGVSRVHTSLFTSRVLTIRAVPYLCLSKTYAYVLSMARTAPSNAGWHRIA